MYQILLASGKVWKIKVWNVDNTKPFHGKQCNHDNDKPNNIFTHYAQSSSIWVPTSLHRTNQLLPTEQTPLNILPL